MKITGNKIILKDYCSILKVKWVKRSERVKNKEYYKKEKAWNHFISSKSIIILNII